MTPAGSYRHDPRRWSFLVPAAGSGDRLGRGPKCLLPLGGEALWQRAVRRAREFAGQVLLAVPEACVADIRRADPACVVMAGGDSRQESVARLLAAATGDRILIHDVARPFGSRRLLHEVAALGERTGAAGCLEAFDSPVARARDGGLAGLLALADAGQVRSPLAFHRAVLEEAHRRAREAGLVARSTVELVVRAGLPFEFAASQPDNIKITNADGYRLAQLLVAAWDEAQARSADPGGRP